MQYLTSEQTRKRTGKMSKTANIIIASLMLSALAGCKTHREHVVGYQVTNPSHGHPIAVSKKPVYLDLEVPRGSNGLTQDQLDNVRGFLSQYRQEGSGKLVISAPSGSPNEVAAFKALKSVRGLIKADGIAYGAVDMTPYYQEEDPQPPLKISYVRYVAQGPECGDWSDNLGDDDRNGYYKNFGCAQQHNLAAMIENPRDLIEPRGASPRMSERRQAGWEKWVKGESPISKRDSKEESAKVSENSGGGE